MSRGRDSKSGPFEYEEANRNTGHDEDNHHLPYFSHDGDNSTLVKIFKTTLKDNATVTLSIPVRMI
jgi:hypothetical protein